MKRRILVLSILFVAAAPIAYVSLGIILYNRLATVLPKCAGAFADNSPAHFTAATYNPDLDTSPYLMPDYQEVSIASRDPRVTLAGWFIPAEEPGAPTILIIHGLGVGTADCRHHPRALLPAGMLHRAGFQVLMVDLRDHGDSTIEDGYWAANTEEYLDVLGAWDWLRTTQNIAPEAIGLFAYSGGTGAGLIAMSEEPQIAAVWLDSVYADITTTIDDRLIRTGFPTFLTSCGLLIARLHGDDLTAYSPLAAARTTGQRPVYITHAVGDPYLSVQYAETLADAIQVNGGNAELWITHGNGHVAAAFEQPTEYEQRLLAFFSGALRS